MSHSNWHTGVYYATIMSGAVVRWRHRVRECEVNASRDGVGFNGSFPIFGIPGLREFSQLIKEAQDVYETLKPDRGDRTIIQKEYPSPAFSAEGCPCKGCAALEINR